MRISVATAAACLGLVGVSLAADRDAGIVQHNLNIPRQTLDVALKELARQTGLQIVRFSDAVKGDAIVGPLNGTYSIDQALRTLLAPSGLTYRSLNSRAYMVVTPQELSEADRRAEAGGLRRRMRSWMWDRLCSWPRRIKAARRAWRSRRAPPKSRTSR